MCSARRVWGSGIIVRRSHTSPSLRFTLISPVRRELGDFFRKRRCLPLYGIYVETASGRRYGCACDSISGGLLGKRLRNWALEAWLRVGSIGDSNLSDSIAQSHNFKIGSAARNKKGTMICARKKRPQGTRR